MLLNEIRAALGQLNRVKNLQSITTLRRDTNRT